ncbi:MAG: 3-phosphoserine/phosphohydroxythreonine transaminase [Polyangiaceae bacterium]|nr:3-phosphoserine/phosphohydroxythreonine transaminase [Polyangiaceae bacterium]
MSPLVPNSTRKLNFSAGPGALPEEALRALQVDLLDLDGSGVGVAELSHRGPEFEKVQAETTSLLRSLLGLGAEHEVLFFQGGATMQFAQIPLAFLKTGQSAAYVEMGTWGEKAIAEATKAAAFHGATIETLASTRADHFRTLPKILAPPKGLDQGGSTAYWHVTSNETIHGVQLPKIPERQGVPLVVDISSDFLSRVVDFSNIDLAYAGAQKNAGPSGLVIVIAKRSFLETENKDLPGIWSYQTALKNGSMFNTPATISIALAKHVLRWLVKQGGVAGIEKVNEAKAALLYAAFEAHPDVYKLPVPREARSRMNAVCTFVDPAREDVFYAEAARRGMVGLRGHRLAGGLRASLYNAVPLRWVESLAGLVHEFAQAK